MSEDRHYLSEPRPCPGLDLPSWEVDIMREGCDHAIMTIIVDKTNLPPRKGKGKKIAWQLPPNLETQPKFGVQDKKRIMEIFKERKKEMKKQKKRASALSSSTPSSSNVSDQSNTNTDSGRASNGTSGNTPRTETTRDDTTNGQGTKNGRNTNKASSRETNGHESLNGNAKPQPGHDDRRPIAGSSASPPPGTSVGIENLAVSDNQNTQRDTNDTSTSSTSSLHLPPAQQQPLQQPQSALPPPPGIPPPSHNFPPSSPPPGLQQQAISNDCQLHSATPLVNPPPGLAPNTSSGVPTRTPNLSQIPLSHQQQQHQQQLLLPPISPGRCFTFSHVLQTASTDPNAIAKLVAEAYYLLLSRNMVDDLDSYYTPHAQRSLTVGGAHAMCVSSVDRRLQLNSLTEMTFSVKGVVQQPSISKSILVSITGVALKPPPHDQMSLLPFCHTLLLVPVRVVRNSSIGHNNATAQSGLGSASGGDGGLYDSGYQIQNDALCFLTANDGSAQQQQQQQNQQQA